MKEEIIAIVIDALREAAAGGDEIELPVTIDGDTKLFGAEGLLDSMALVSLIVAVEQQLSDRFDTGIVLADEKALSQRSSPYRTVGSLADYAFAQLPQR